MAKDDFSYAANCGYFWVANSVVSTVLGKINRESQERIMLDSLDFQKEIERVRNSALDELEAEKIAFQRTLLKINRQNAFEQRIRKFNQQLDAIELDLYIKECWPLDKAEPRSIREEIIKINETTADSQPLNVILLRTPLLPVERRGANPRDREIYQELERKLKNRLNILDDVYFRYDSCRNIILKNGNANIMNIHFLMGCLPTLVITPQCDNRGKLIFNAAVWEASATRPLMRSLFSLDYEPFMAVREEYAEYFKQAIDKIETALITIVATIRDSYMLLTQNKPPRIRELLDDAQKKIIEEDNNLKVFVKTEYENITKALDAKKTPKLLEVYSKTDVESMKSQAHEISLIF